MSASVNKQRGLQGCRNWNAMFSIGTVVFFDGREVKTESHAGLGLRDIASVFLHGVEEAVPIERIDVPGYVRSNRKNR